MPKKGMPRVVGGWGKCWRCLSEQVNTSREDIILLGHYQSQLAMATSTPPNFIQKLTEGKIVSPKRPHLESQKNGSVDGQINNLFW